MIEYLYIFVPPLGWILWSLGGTTWKSWRRFVWPAVLTIALMFAGIGWVRPLITGILVSFTAHLGYGDTKTWLQRWVVGMSYGAALWAISFVWWLPLATGAWFTGTMYLSRRFASVTWKICEGSVGLIQGLLAVWIL